MLSRSRSGAGANNPSAPAMEVCSQQEAAALRSQMADLQVRPVLQCFQGLLAVSGALPKWCLAPSPALTPLQAALEQSEQGR